MLMANARESNNNNAMTCTNKENRKYKNSDAFLHLKLQQAMQKGEKQSKCLSPFTWW